MKQNHLQYSPKQGRLPVYIADILDICDPVLTFDQIMEEIGIEQYLKPRPVCYQLINTMFVVVKGVFHIFKGTNKKKVKRFRYRMPEPFRL